MTAPSFDTPTRAASRQYWIDRVTRIETRARLGSVVASANPNAAAPGHAIERRVPVDDELLGRLVAVTGASPFLTLVAVSAAWALVMYRDSGIRQVAWATPTSLADGEVANTLVHALTVDSAQSFRALLGQVRGSMLETDRHRRYPFALVLDALQRTASDHDLFDVAVADATLHGATPAVGQVLTITIEHQGSSVVLAASGTTSFDHAAAMTRLLERVLRALRAGLTRPDAPMATLDLVGEDERARVLNRWNPPDAAWPVTTVHEMVARHVREHPDAVAVSALDGERAMTFRDLDDRSTVLARRLVALGVEPDEVVGICLEISPEILVAILAVWKAGAGYVPMDRSQPAPRLRHIVDDAGARVVIADPANRTDAQSWNARTVDVADAAQMFDSAVRLPEPDPRRLAYVIYTSGSSGLPKGVMVEHRSLSNYLHWAAAFYRPEAGCAVPVTSSPAFDLAVTSLLLPLTCGQRVVLDPALLTGDGLLTRLTAEAGASLLKVTPAQALALGDALPAPDLRALTRCLVLGGEALRESHLSEWRRHAPATRLINEYGPTETTVGCCVHETTAAESGATVPIGRPIANTRLYVLDADLQPVPDEVVGELYIAGTGLARAFRNLSRETAALFLPDPFAAVPGTRMYRSSDLVVRHADGDLEFVGRRDRQVKLRGYRIELGEVERALAGVPGVKAAAAARVGDGQQAQIAAWIVPDGNAPALRVLRQHLSRALPEYMVPQSIAVVRALPLTANGKVDFPKLVLPWRKPAPSATPPVAGTTTAETALLAIWREVLDAPTLGVDDNFFEYGGDSIVSIRVVGRARQAGWKVLPSQVFEHPTVSMLACVAEPWHEAAPAAVDGEPVPLTPVQRWFLQSAADVDRCCQTRLVELARPIEAERLDAALRLVVSRHDALRLRFECHDGGWQQSIAAAATTPLLRLVDLSAVAPEEREALWGAARTAGIDALRVSGPIVHAALMTAGSDTPAQLFIAVHHVAIDHLSWHVVLGELEAAVDATDALGAPGLSFGAWAGYLAQRAAEGAFDADARAWLSANQPGADVEEAWVAAADRRREVRRTVAEFDEAETAVILRGMHAAYNTQARDALLTALATALIEEGGGSAVRVALESSGRAPFADAIDITRTVGWFTAVSPLVIRLDLREPAERRLVQVKELLRRAPADATAFGAARLWSPDEALRRALSALPDPAVGFNYLGRVDGETDRRSLFRARPGSYGEQRPTNGFCPHRVEVTAVVVNGRLVTEFLWSEPRDHRDTATNVTDRYVAALRALIEVCLRGDGPGVTPSDFALVTLDESTLANLLDEVGRGDDAPS